jgi:hypothetical protein
LFAQYQRLADRLHALKSTQQREARAPLFAQQDVELILRSYPEPGTRYQKALELCLGEADAQHGHLYLLRDEELWLAAKSGLELPASASVEILLEQVQAHRARTFETEHLPLDSADNENGGASPPARPEAQMTTLGPNDANPLRVAQLASGASAFLLVPPSGAALGVLLLAHDTRALRPLASTFLTQIAESVAHVADPARA